MTIPHPSHAKLPRQTRRLALLAAGAFVLGVDGCVHSGLLPAVAHDLAVSWDRWLALAAGNIAVPALIANLTTAPQLSPV